MPTKIDKAHADCLQALTENRVHIQYATGHTSSVINLSGYLSDIARARLEEAMRLLNGVRREVEDKIRETRACHGEGEK